MKELIFKQLIESKGMCQELGITSIAQMRLRNIKNADLGSIVRTSTADGEECTIEDFVLWDNKEFYIQKADHENLVEQSRDLGRVYNILVREWNADSWELGPVHEVQVEKMIKCCDLAQFLHDNLYPHIPVNQMFAARINLTVDKPFIRSDLNFCKW